MMETQSWTRPEGATARPDGRSDMSGAEYAVAAAGLGMSYSEIGETLGVSIRQAARYAGLPYVPAWTAAELRRLERLFCHIAQSVAAADGPVRLKADCPPDMPPGAWRACVALAQRLRWIRDGVLPREIAD